VRQKHNVLYQKNGADANAISAGFKGKHDELSERKAYEVRGAWHFLFLFRLAPKSSNHTTLQTYPP